ncbi:MAG TPA: DUF262 domain-containing protein [Kofleriaceae bacterium]|nr:DUF262 domain-containing protein [Kofleriaceae bacterium]
MATKLTAPTPEVQYLPAIFRRIQRGDIRMPAFQRGFVWKPSQILELLESIYRGFPIGSVLLWRVDGPILRVEEQSKSVFPQNDDSYPAYFVLDGLQRLSTLYAVFHFDPKHHDKMFRVSFDLEQRTFATTDPSRAAEHSIALSDLFSPREFLKRQQALASTQEGEALIDRAVELYSTFQEYLLPIVTIAGRDISDVVGVFERVNSTGTKLSAVDFMRAVTWSEHFDLNSQITEIRRDSEARGFSIPGETLVKVLAISMGKLPTPESMLELRESTSRDLLRGVKKAKDILARVAAYLSSYLHIKSYAFVPYEGQFLMLSRFFSDSGSPSDAQLRTLTRWFWSTSFSEELQGRSDNQIANNVIEMGEFRSGAKTRLRFSLKLTSETLLKRKFRRGNALSSAFASMLAHVQCRSLFTGDEIDLNEYMTDDAGKNYTALVNSDRGEYLSKVVANTFVCADADLASARQLSGMSIVRRLLKRHTKADAEEILESQLLPDEVVQALLRGNGKQALTLRAEHIVKIASELANISDDTP